MKKPPYKLITTSLVCTVLLGFIGCSDMLSKLDNIHWGATYTVRHLLQDLNRDGTGVEVGRYTEDLYERETLINTVPNTLSEAKVKEIPGFTPTVTNDDIEQVIVNGDGSTTIDIKYNRNEVELTFDANGGYFVNTEGKQVTQETIKQIYGTQVSLPKPVLINNNFTEIVLTDLVPINDSPLLNKRSDNMYIKFPAPAKNGNYKALWFISSPIKKFLESGISIPSQLKLTGDVDDGDITELSTALQGSNQQIVLDLEDLTISNELILGKIPKTDTEPEVTNSYFSSKNLTKVTLPTEGKVKLGYGAFSSCPNLESITIGSNVDVLHGGAFWGSTKLHFEVDSNHPSLVATSDGTALLRKTQDVAEKIEYSLVSYPSASGNINLGKLGFTITAIEEDALALLPDGNTTITFPATVKVIGPYADYQIDQGAHLTIIMEGTEPPTLPGEVNVPCSTFGSKVNIYVPDESLEDYQNAWQNYADKHDIYPMSEYGLP